MDKLKFITNKPTIYKITAMLLLIIFFIFLYFFNKNIKITPLYENNGTAFEKAIVTDVVKDNIQEDGTRVGNQVVHVEILSGPYKGKTYEAISLDSYLYGAACQEGTRVIVQTSTYTDNVDVSVYNYDRSMVIYLMIATVIFFLWLIGGRKGIKSALALAFSFVCILYLYLPMLYLGYSAFLASIIVVALTTIVSLLMIGGATLKTLVSIISTVMGVIVAGLAATLFGYLAHISGYNVNDIENLLYISQNSGLDVGGLLFSGILIASLGVAMDTSFSIATSINEIFEQNPSMTAKQIINSGMNIGRDILNININTLIFAYTGSSVAILISMYAYNYPYNMVINMYSIGIEILQALTGTLGVILIVPICTIVASWLYTRIPNRFFEKE